MMRRVTVTERILAITEHTRYLAILDDADVAEFDALDPDERDEWIINHNPYEFSEPTCEIEDLRDTLSVSVDIID